MSILVINKSALAKDVWFNESMMFILLEYGREIGVQLEWFSRLSDSNKEDLRKWRLIGGGQGIHWEDLDEDILVEALL